MKDTHITVRIPATLEKLLERLSRERAVPKSQLVREALVAYFRGSRAETYTPAVTGAELARRLADIPHLDPADAEDFAKDIEDARRKLPQPRDKWE